MSSDKTYHDKNSSKSVFQMASAEIEFTIDGFFRLFDVSWIFACIEINSVWCAVISKIKIIDTRNWLIYLVWCILLLSPGATCVRLITIYVWIDFICTWIHLNQQSIDIIFFFSKTACMFLRSKEMKKNHRHTMWMEETIEK